jgi:hypothetical protein
MHKPKKVKAPIQDMCPLCTKPFNAKDIVITFERWDYGDKMKAHLDCLLYGSAVEERAHPPLSRLMAMGA